MPNVISSLRQVAVAACAMALILPAAPQARAAKHELRLGAVVSTAVRLRSVSQPSTIDVPKPESREQAPVSSSTTQIEVFSNAGSFTLHFDIVDADVTAVDVEGLGSAARVLPGGLTVHLALSPEDRNVSRRTLSYRIRYAPGSTPGARPHPVRIFLQNT